MEPISVSIALALASAATLICCSLLVLQFCHLLLALANKRPLVVWFRLEAEPKAGQTRAHFGTATTTTTTNKPQLIWSKFVTFFALVHARHKQRHPNRVTPVPLAELAFHGRHTSRIANIQIEPSHKVTLTSINTHKLVQRLLIRQLWRLIWTAYRPTVCHMTRLARLK